MHRMMVEEVEACSDGDRGNGRRRLIGCGRRAARATEKGKGQRLLWGKETEADYGSSRPQKVVVIVEELGGRQRSAGVKTWRRRGSGDSSQQIWGHQRRVWPPANQGGTALWLGEETTGAWVAVRGGGQGSPPVIVVKYGGVDEDEALRRDRGSAVAVVVW